MQTNRKYGFFKNRKKTNYLSSIEKKKTIHYTYFSMNRKYFVNFSKNNYIKILKLKEI